MDHLIEEALAEVASHTETERPRLEEQLSSTRAEIARLEANRRLPGPRPRPPYPPRGPARAGADLTRRLGTEAHTPPDTAALAGLADRLEQIIASESPEQAKELLRLLVKEIRVHDRRC